MLSRITSYNVCYTKLLRHHREDAEFGEVGRPAEKLLDALVFPRCQAVVGDHLGGDFGIGGSGLVHDAPE